MKKIFITFIMSFLIDSNLAKAQTGITKASQIDSRGLDIPADIMNLPDTDHNKIGYIILQRRRTRNRMLLDMALSYSPISYVTGSVLDPFHAKDKNYILHADVSPQFVIGGERIIFPVLLTPRYHVRILGNDAPAGDVSSPVRTPSFMPGGTIFIPFQNLMTEESKTISFGSITVSHHSNGQDGVEFYAPGVFNKYNGNFSTNYVEPALWRRWRYGGTVPADPLFLNAKQPYCDLFAKLSYTLYFNTDEILAPSYGAGMVNINTGLVRVTHNNDIHANTGCSFNKPYYVETYRILFNASYITGSRTLGLDALKKRINTEASFHYKIPQAPNTAAMFSCGYYGSDPYNIFYADSYFYARIGLSLGLFVSPKRERL